MSDTVQIYDSTLRDGSQAEGISFSVDDKLMIARRLDDMGIHYIEGGWPNPTTPKDLEFFIRARDLDLKTAQIVAFGSTRRPSNPAEDDATLRTLVEAGTQSVAIFGKSWTMHVTEALRTTLEKNLDLIRDSVAFLRSENRRVVYDAEHFFDGYKADAGYAVSTLLAAQEGGAEILVLCDTNGGMMPSEMRDIIEDAKGRITLPFGIHAHNDAGMGIANSIVAVELGAIQVQGTINGYGERCGNANLCGVIPNLELKLGRTTIGRENLTRLMDLSRFVSEVANVAHDHRCPYVGESAFAHKGGVHIDATMKHPGSYEHVSPEATGNERRFLLSEQSGGATVAAKLDHLLGRFIPGFDKQHPTVRKLLQDVKQKEHEGYVFEAADASVEILARRALGTFRDPFRLIGYHIVNRKADDVSETEAIVKIDVNGEVFHTVADGDGPINALDAALRRALETVYPSLRQVHLEDYKVRVLSSQDGTAARVRVLIESSDGEDSWNTIGVSENIIDASWIALVDSLSYKLLKDETLILETAPHGTMSPGTPEDPV